MRGGPNAELPPVGGRVSNFVALHIHPQFETDFEGILEKAEYTFWFV